MRLLHPYTPASMARRVCISRLRTKSPSSILPRLMLCKLSTMYVHPNQQVYKKMQRLQVMTMTESPLRVL
jgi:hypothetical protein